MFCSTIVIGAVLELPALQRGKDGKCRVSSPAPSEDDTTSSNSLDSEFEEIHDRVRALSTSFEIAKKRVKKAGKFQDYKRLRREKLREADPSQGNGSLNLVLSQGQLISVATLPTEQPILEKDWSQSLLGGIPPLEHL